eukprot:m51a1_g9195 hypothetical protein (163) ;mRNA; r:96070-96712
MAAQRRVRGSATLGRIVAKTESNEATSLPRSFDIFEGALVETDEIYYDESDRLYEEGGTSPLQEARRPSRSFPSGPTARRPSIPCGFPQPLLRSHEPEPSSSTVPCRFFGTTVGCKRGDSCPFAHNLVAGPARTTTPVLYAGATVDELWEGCQRNSAAKEKH